MNRAQKEAYKRDYAAAKADGKPFFPYAIYKDLIVATFAIAIIIALAIWAKVGVGPEIDPTKDYVPRPEWYFFFLFQLLKIFKNQDALRPVIMATFIIPNVLLGLLFLWPFLDRGPERRIHKRPFSMMVAVATIAFLGFMTYKGATSPEGGSAQTAPPPPFQISDPNALAGYNIFASAKGGCLACHTVKGLPGGNVGPNLTNEGNVAGHDKAWQIAHLKDPQQFTPSSIMPKFANLPPQELDQVATFLTQLGKEIKP